MKPILCPFVFVRWLDAVTRHGWTTSDEKLEGVEPVWSSGHMVERNKVEVKLVSDVGEEGTDVNRRIAIPTQMIDRIHFDAMDGPILYERPKRKSRAATPSEEVPNE